jgi:hypothetical protein
MRLRMSAHVIKCPLKLTGMAPYTFRHFSFQLCQA